MPTYRVFWAGMTRVFGDAIVDAKTKKQAEYKVKTGLYSTIKEEWASNALFGSCPCGGKVQDFELWDETTEIV